MSTLPLNATLLTTTIKEYEENVANKNYYVVWVHADTHPQGGYCENTMRQAHRHSLRMSHLRPLPEAQQSN